MLLQMHCKGFIQRTFFVSALFGVYSMSAFCSVGISSKRLTTVSWSCSPCGKEATLRRVDLRTGVTLLPGVLLTSNLLLNLAMIIKQ